MVTAVVLLVWALATLGARPLSGPVSSVVVAIEDLLGVREPGGAP